MKTMETSEDLRYPPGMNVSEVSAISRRMWPLTHFHRMNSRGFTLADCWSPIIEEFSGGVNKAIRIWLCCFAEKIGEKTVGRPASSCIESLDQLPWDRIRYCCPAGRKGV